MRSLTLSVYSQPLNTLQVVGEFLSTPAITMADAATLGYLDDDVASYGRQRMYGSFGWAIAMFFVGIALDYSNVFPNHPCGTIHVVDRNYMTCYAVFAVLMCCAFITATQFRFKEVCTVFWQYFVIALSVYTLQC